MPGLPNTHVIPPDWEQHHRPVSADAMTAECVITRPTSTAGWDDTTGKSAYPTPATIYGPGPCRINRGGSGAVPAGATTVADRTVTLVDYAIVIPTSAPLIQVHDLVTVTTCTGDPQLVDLTLRVKDVARGGLTWERVLSCELQPPTSR